MRVKHISLNNYRNYSEQSIAPTEGLNVFIGANAQGKTNLIESMEYAALGRSQRASKDVELIRWEQSSAAVRIAFEKFGVEHSVSFELNTQKPRRLFFNEQPIRIRELIGKFNVVYFSPEDLFLIKGTPAARRRFLDAEISQASPAYFFDLITYNKILAQRNSLLKSIKEGAARSSGLELWNEQLAGAAARIVVPFAAEVSVAVVVLLSIETPVGTSPCVTVFINVPSLVIRSIVKPVSAESLLTISCDVLVVLALPLNEICTALFESLNDMNPSAVASDASPMITILSFASNSV